MSQTTGTLKGIVSHFIEACGPDYEFPAGGQTEFLTRRETELFDALNRDEPSTNDKLQAISEGRDWSDCYSIVIFGIRLAVIGVRSSRANTFRAGIIALVAGGPKLDWRDALRAFAIFEICAVRLGLDFQSEIERHTGQSTNEAFRSTLDSFFSRSIEMRALDTMGLEQVGDGEELTFVSVSTF